jgi:hypothetical protein
MTRRGFPHSETPGSKLVCSSPRLIAAYCVLHRLLAPRHSPYALSSLIIGMELTRSAPDRLASVPLPTLTKHCACLWIGKTTVCRIFSCQRTTGGPASRRILSRAHSRRAVVAPLRSRGALAFARAKLVHQPVRLACQPKPQRQPRPAKAGGEYRARTGDLLVANQALSQLS